MDILSIISISTIIAFLIGELIYFLKLKIELEKVKMENERYKNSLVLNCMELIDKLSKMQDKGENEK